MFSFEMARMQCRVNSDVVLGVLSKKLSSPNPRGQLHALTVRRKRLLGWHKGRGFSQSIVCD